MAENMVRITLGEALSILKRKEMKFLRLLKDYKSEVLRDLDHYKPDVNLSFLAVSDATEFDSMKEIFEEVEEKAKERKKKSVESLKSQIEKLMMDLVRLKIAVQKANKESGIDDYLSELKYVKIALSTLDLSDEYHSMTVADLKEYGILDMMDKLEKRKYEIESKILNKNHTTFIEIDKDLLKD
jgi:translation elongation factor EF-1beta